MRWNTFGRSAGFAAAAGCGVMPWLLVAGPLLGGHRALSFYLVAVAAAYVTGIAPTLRSGLRAGVLTGGIGTGLCLITHTLPELALGLAVVLALVRTGLLYRSRPGRAVALEIGLVTGGLLFARFLAGGSLLSVMLALWGFLLVQSVFFLVGGVTERPPGTPHNDPFDAAHERANTLLDRLAV